MPKAAVLPEPVEDWPIIVNGTDATPSSFNGAEGVNVTLDAGTYAVSEDNLTGYAMATSAACAGYVKNGETKYCNITNDDAGATLTVVKRVSNNNGGTLEVANFTLRVNGTQVQSGDATALNAGTYVVSEDTINGYNGTIGGDCDVNGTVILQVGDAKTCTIVNDDMQATLTVIKQVTNDNGGTLNVSDFTLYINTSVVASGQQNNIDAGAYVVSEDEVNGYVGVISGDCAANGSIILLPGDNKTCYISNDDATAMLTVIKQVINDNGGTLQVSDFPLAVDNATVTSNSTVPVSAGTHIVSETNQAGYTGSFSGDCDANGSVTLTPGQAKTCIVTNDDQQAHLTVTKIIVNDNGGNLTIGDVQLFINGSSVTNGTSNQLNAGAYLVSENSPVGYATLISGDCDANGNVALLPGENKTCTITNDDSIAIITVTKIVVNNNGGTKGVAEFPLFLNNNSVTSGTSVNVSAGTHSVTETGSVGYNATYSGDCDANGSITALPGQLLECTITNDDMPAQLIVNKVVINDNGGTMSVSNFTLYVNSTQVTSGAVNAFDAGTYLVSENGSASYAATFSGDCTANGTVTLAPGDAKTCTITNNDRQQLTCEEAKKSGLLKGYVINNTALIFNDANESFLISLASYKMYSATIFDQTLFDNESIIIGANSNATMNVDVPACGYQIDLICGMPLTTFPDYGNRTIDFDFGNQNNYCSKEANGSVSLAVAPWFPQGNNYVFACSASGFVPTSYDWYFGDGATQLNSANKNVYHTYANGNYTVTCTAKNGSQTGTGVLNVLVGNVSIPVPPTNATNATNQTNSTGNATACYAKLKDVPVSCVGGNITFDVTTGCRTIICQNGASSMRVSACNKPDNTAPAYFEMYKQLQVGTDVKQICLGTTCIKDNGFAKGPSYPICSGNASNQSVVPPVNLTTNVTNQTNNTPSNVTGNMSAVLAVAPWYPQGNNYVLVCNATGFVPTSYDWYFGDGAKQLNSANKNVFHAYGSGEFDATCIAKQGVNNATGTLHISAQ